MANQIECLMCGKMVARIGNHIAKHNMNISDYRIMFPDSETCAYKHSPETLEKMRGVRPSFRGVPKSKEHRRKLSESRAGKKTRPHSPETLEKMRAAWRRRKADTDTYAVYIQGVRERMSTPEMVDAVSKRIIQRIKDGTHNGKSKDTGIEILFKEFLERKNICYEHQFIMLTPKGNFIFDFYITDKNLLVEVDGEYWHRKSKMQINRDQLKERLARAQGYDFVRISDKDWKPEIIFEEKIKRDIHSADIMEKRTNIQAPE